MSRAPLYALSASPTTLREHGLGSHARVPRLVLPRQAVLVMLFQGTIDREGTGCTTTRGTKMRFDPVIPRGCPEPDRISPRCWCHYRSLIVLFEYTSITHQRWVMAPDPSLVGRGSSVMKSGGMRPPPEVGIVGACSVRPQLGQQAEHLDVEPDEGGQKAKGPIHS